MDFGTLQPVKWITLGGVGDAANRRRRRGLHRADLGRRLRRRPGARRAATWGMTLEAMDKDDVGAAAGCAAGAGAGSLADPGQARGRHLHREQRRGPTLTDTGALFNATAVTTAGRACEPGHHRAVDDDWAAAKLAMRKQVEVNSGERLGALASPGSCSCRRTWRTRR